MIVTANFYSGRFRRALDMVAQVVVRARALGSTGGGNDDSSNKSSRSSGGGGDG